MTVRPPIDATETKKVFDRLERRLGRIFLLWALGIIFGAVKLKPTGINVGGISYIIEKPELVQGMLFLMCIALYLVCFADLFGHSLIYATPNKSAHRRFIYTALGSRRTLRGKSLRELKIIKMAARVAFKGVAVIFMAVFFLPLVHIIAFERSALWTALKAIFN